MLTTLLPLTCSTMDYCPSGCPSALEPAGCGLKPLQTELNLSSCNSGYQGFCLSHKSKTQGYYVSDTLSDYEEQCQQQVHKVRRHCSFAPSDSTVLCSLRNNPTDRIQDRQETLLQLIKIPSKPMQIL